MPVWDRRLTFPISERNPPLFQNYPLFATEPSELRAEVKKAFKRDIPLAERDDWSKYLTDQRTHHESLTSQIVGLETQMNTVVYAAFDLTPDEIALIEKTTKYRYGEV